MRQIDRVLNDIDLVVEVGRDVNRGVSDDQRGRHGSGHP